MSDSPLRPGRRARPARGWGRGPVAPPRVHGEELEIHTADGAVLRGLVDDPPDDVPLVGTFVLAHALFARSSTFGRAGRPGLRALLASRGFRTVTFDFRGHGESRAPGGLRSWTYDELVRFDLPAVVECARARGDDLPVLVCGHALGGHVALAAQGTKRMRADGILAIASGIWLRELEPSRLHRFAKRLVARAVLPVVTRLEVIPARRLGLGSDDAPARAVEGILAMPLAGAWRSADGADDYLAALADVDVPVAAVVSEGDRLQCRPEAGASFARRCGGPVEVITVRASDDGGPPPGHVELVTTPRAESALARAVAWLGAEVKARAPSPPVSPAARRRA